MHAQQTRIACMARERSELEAKESLAQAQIAKLQQQLQELQFSYAAERSRSELLESKVCELELAVRNKDLQLAEFQSAEKEARPTGLGEVNLYVRPSCYFTWGKFMLNYMITLAVSLV